MYIWASPRARRHHSVPFNTDQKLIIFILLLNSDVFYKSKSGTHGEPGSLKPARKEANYMSFCLPPSLGSSGLLTSWWGGMPTASLLGFYWGKRALESWEGERKRSMGASSLQTSPLPLPPPLIFYLPPLSATILPGRLSAFKTFWQSLYIKGATGPQEEKLCPRFSYSN